MTNPLAAYELESLNEELKMINMEEGYYTAEDYPFIFKAKFSILGSIIEISIQGPVIGLVHDAGIRDLLGFDSVVIYENCLL